MKYSDWKVEEQINQETLRGILAGEVASLEGQETARLSSSSVNGDRTHLNETLEMLSRSRGTLPKEPKLEVSMTGQRHASIEVTDETFAAGSVLNPQRYSNMLTPRRKLALLKDKILHQLRASQPLPQLS